MAGSPTYGPEQIFGVNGADMSIDEISSIVLIPDMSGLSFGFSWTGSSPVGILQVEVSNDYSTNVNGSVKTAGTWNVLPFSVSGTFVTSIPVSGSTGNGFIDVGQTHAYAIRVVYTATSGTGIILGTSVGKFV